jgi:hypothetical protein
MPSLWKPEENRERFRIISAFLGIDIASLQIRLALVWIITEAAPPFAVFECRLRFRFDKKEKSNAKKLEKRVKPIPETGRDWGYLK